MIFRVLAILLLTATSAAALTQQLTDIPPVRQTMTDYQIKDLIVEESRDAYPGTCPCPYSKDNTSCLGRSAYEQAEGLRPMCYPDDVVPSMTDGYRTKHDIPKE